MSPRKLIGLACMLLGLPLIASAALEIAPFDSDATPVPGTALAYELIN
jgi:hypothetical protein